MQSPPHEASSSSADDARTPVDEENAAFFAMSLDLLCVAGFDGYWKRLNPSWTRTLGWTVEELMAEPIDAFIHPEDLRAMLDARDGLKEGRPVVGLVNRYRCKDGSYRWLEWRSVAHLDSASVYATARDVTSERQAKETEERLQRQLMIADRMASVGTLAAGVAHEINNPLAYVMANLEMIADEVGQAAGALPAVAKDWVEMAVEARHGAERIRKVVRGLMTFARVDDERRAVVDVVPVLDLSIDMAWNEIRHRARLVKDLGDTPKVEADEARLGQVFVNLLVNAAQAVGDGDAEANEIRVVTSTDDAGRAVIEVRDTGPGIPADALGRIFDPFFTTKPVGIGSGLGLSVCHSIVRGMGGEISAENGAKRGAVFRVVLPATAADAEPAPASAPLAPATRRASLLVVDDDRAVAASLGRLLRAYDVTVAASGKEAIAALEARPSFDVILTDLMMPEVSGMELYEEVRRRHPQLAERMVFVTGGAFTPEARAFLARVPNARLTKPLDASALRKLVDALVT